MPELKSLKAKPSLIVINKQRNNLPQQKSHWWSFKSRIMDSLTCACFSLNVMGFGLTMLHFLSLFCSLLYVWPRPCLVGVTC